MSAWWAYYHVYFWLHSIQLLKGGTKGKDASKVKADIRSGACQVSVLVSHQCYCA